MEGVREIISAAFHRILIAFVLAGPCSPRCTSRFSADCYHHQGKLSPVVQHRPDHALLLFRDSGRYCHDRDGFISVHSLA